FAFVGAGYLIHWLIQVMPLGVAFAVAAIVSPTDPVAVSSITTRVPMPGRLMHILEGESLLNDASGLVCFQFAVVAAMTGTFSLGSAALTFLWVALAGLGCGLLLTLAVVFVQRKLTRMFGEEGGSSILVTLLIPFGAYLLGEQLHASGIVAAGAAGITMSYVELTGRTMASTRLERSTVWNTIQFTLNGIMFVLLGEQLPGILRGAAQSVRESGHAQVWWLGVYAVAITLGLALLRFAWVWLSLRMHLLHARHRHGETFTPPSWRLVCATSLSGVRGAITLAGILTLPLLMPDGSAFPARNLAIFLAASVILLSLIGASIGLPLLLKGLTLPVEPLAQQQENHARAMAIEAGIESVKKACDKLRERPDDDTTNLCDDAANRVINVYQKRQRGTESDSTDAEQLRKADALERELRLAGLRGERERILELARHRRISDATSRK